MPVRNFAMLLVLVTVLAANGFQMARAATPEVLVAPTPEWVAFTEPATLSPEMIEESGGAVYLLVDSQSYSSTETEHHYFRRVTHAANIEGVEEASDIEITFDPSYQTLNLHHLKIIRNGKVIDKTDNTEIDLARLERDLDRRIYNAEWTAMVRLADVRSGDDIDAAWSISGRDPVFGKRDFAYFRLGWETPVHKRFLRANWPTASIARWKANFSPVEPILSTLGDRTILTTGPYVSPAINLEKGTPKWVQQTPMLEITSFANWQQVRDWAMPYYQLTTPSKEIQSLAMEVGGNAKTDEEKVLAALRFTQEEIRYLSIAIGEGGYVPRKPETTLQKRFGDCKDKTMLFVALLQAMGIKAEPVLVSTETGPGLLERLPSPGLFDHVIAKVQLEGQTYWLDGTAKGQRGALSSFEQARYGYALVLGEEASSLELIPQSTDETITEKIMETIDVSGGLDKPVLLSSVSEFRGDVANRIRNKLAIVGRKGLQKDYLDFYKNYFPGIRYENPMQITDDPDQNILKIVEKLIADDPYYLDEDRGFYELSYLTYAIPEMLNDQAGRKRKTPILIASDIHARHEVSVILSDKGRNWELAPEQVEMDNAAFRFSWDARKKRGKWLLKAEIHSKSRTAHANQAANILDDHERMRNSVRWGLQMPIDKKKN